MSTTRSVSGSYHSTTSVLPGASTIPAIHSSGCAPSMRSGTTSGRFAVALLVLLATAAGTRLVAADLLARDHRPLLLARARAGQRGIERLDHDLGRLQDRHRGLGRHRGLLDVLREQLGELGVDVRLLGDECRRDALVR